MLMQTVITKKVVIIIITVSATLLTLNEERTRKVFVQTVKCRPLRYFSLWVLIMG